MYLVPPKEFMSLVEESRVQYIFYVHRGGVLKVKAGKLGTIADNEPVVKEMLGWLEELKHHRNVIEVRVVNEAAFWGMV